MNKIFFGIKCIWYYFWGHIFGALFYKRKYYYGRNFKGKYGGILAPGWKWICYDALHRRNNPEVPWPVSPRIGVAEADGIIFHPDDLNNFQGFGNYFQNWLGGKIIIGKGTYIAPNVGIITTNHTIGNLDEHDAPKNVTLGERCWIGMNSVILPGVILGDDTVVGAGAVVTKSFPEGHCVIGGNPAKVIRKN